MKLSFNASLDEYYIETFLYYLGIEEKVNRVYKSDEDSRSRDVINLSKKHEITNNSLEENV